MSTYMTHIRVVVVAVFAGWFLKKEVLLRRITAFDLIGEGENQMDFAGFGFAGIRFGHLVKTSKK
ncbi:MAG: hypothetical protein KA479_04125 [Saprospiraceae bacterium]|nr:hypothetical protein [Saprospiraceae bacterium]